MLKELTAHLRGWKGYFGFWLGITIERIQPGHPQQNGRHERMHRTLKMEATRPPASNFLQQQAKFENSPILSTIGQLWSPAAEESAFTKRKLISVPLSQVKLWVSKRSTTASGWSALWV
jgi:transposase InsO family protein